MLTSCLVMKFGRWLQVTAQVSDLEERNQEFDRAAKKVSESQ